MPRIYKIIEISAVVGVIATLSALLIGAINYRLAEPFAC